MGAASRPNSPWSVLLEELGSIFVARGQLSDAIVAISGR